MSYDILIFDADNTLLDFDFAEKQAHKNASKIFNLEVNETLYRTYQKINDSWWKKYEQALFTKDEITVFRFKEYLALINSNVDPSLFNQTFLNELSNCTQTISGAYEVLENLKKLNKRIFIATNGITRVQQKRLNTQDFIKFVDGIFVSEEMGYPKPELNFFINAQKKANLTFDKSTLIIGDSLTSDIKGGNNLGVDTCWFNPKNEPLKDGFKVNYIITKLEEIIDIVK